MLSDAELAQVQEATREITAPPTMTLNPGVGGDPFERELFNVARQIVGVSMNHLGIEEGTHSVLPGKPSLTVSSGGSSNIHYLAVPEGPELKPFLEAIRGLGKAGDLGDSEPLRSLDGLTSPAKVIVLVAPSCPNCPSVVHKVISIAVRNPLVDVIIVDAVQFSDVAARYKVRSTPTVIVNDAATFVGQVSDEDLVKHLIPHDTGHSFTEVLKSMIDAGRAEDAAQLMCRNKNPKAILPIYQSEEFSSRLGALVVMDEALEIDPACLDPIVEDLIRILSEGDTPVQGDTAELLGRIRHPAAIPALEKAAEDPNPDVREAAQEALELIKAPAEKH